MSSPKFTVAVVGGGIGGVILSLSLSKRSDIQFDLYEAASGFHSAGASVGIFGRSLTAAKHLGIVEDLEKIVTGPPSGGITVAYRKSDISPKGVHIARRVHPKAHPGSGSYYRPKFLETLASLLPAVVKEKHIHFSKRLTHYVQNPDGVTLHFDDGTTAVCDVLVGADGIKSPTRYSLYRELAALETDESRREGIVEQAVPMWSGMVAFRGLVPFDEVEAMLGEKHQACTERVFYSGHAAHIFANPVLTERKVNIVAFTSKPVIPEHAGLKPSELPGAGWPANRPWVEQTSPEPMLEAYAGFEDSALCLLKCMKAPSRWAIHQLDHLPHFVNDRVCLLGDAAHATQPHQGQGANQAIESAYVLGEILASEATTKENIPLALKAYEQVRRKRANDVITVSKQSGLVYQFLTEPFEDMEKLKEYHEGPWLNWLFMGDCGDDVMVALEWMKAQH